jgi:hypothetical protein
MGFLRQLSECCLRVLAQHANHALSVGTPGFSRGAADVAAFYKTRPVFCPSDQPKSGCSILLRAKLVWVLFWAVAKEYLARRATTAIPEQKSVVNIKNK